MSEYKHTPGEWRVEDGTTLVWGNCNPDDNSSRGMGYPIAESRINPSGNWSTGPYADEGEANARLISAVPDMLDALMGLLQQNEEFCQRTGLGDTDQMEVARAAISKALTPIESTTER